MKFSFCLSTFLLLAVFSLSAQQTDSPTEPVEVYNDQEKVESTWSASHLTPEIRNNLLGRESMFTTKTKVTFSIWDGAISDGESISLYFNGQQLAEELILTKVAQIFEVDLIEGINEVRFEVLSQGSEWRQTPILSVTDGVQTYYLTLYRKSDGEASMIIVKD